MWDEIKRLRDRGVTVILTTQYLEEADELADRIAIIDEGLVVAEGTSDQLKASIGGDVITFSFSNNSDLENAKKLLTDYEQEGNDLRITVKNGASKIPSFVNKLTENIFDIRIKNPKMYRYRIPPKKNESISSSESFHFFDHD